MIIKIDVSNETAFKKAYSEFVKLENICVSEDNVAHGIQEAIVIGLTFVFESSLSGFTWELIKGQILPYLRQLFTNKRKQDRIYVSIIDNDEEYDLDIPNNFSDTEIKIPGKLEMKLKR